jgi:hydroxyacylglutathione hydrolase
MSIEILKLTLGPVQTNCFVIGDAETRDAIVIDPSDRPELIYKSVQELDWTVREILATHGHFDHVLASATLKKLTGAPFRLHERDYPLVKSMPQRAREWLSIDVSPAAEPDGFVDEGDVITAGGIALDVIYTPGHTPGHVSYVLRSEKIVFSGDCLFYLGIGRTDLPGSRYATLLKTITSRLLPLGDDFSVAPGHMRNTTISYERAHNPYILEYLASNPS